MKNSHAGKGLLIGVLSNSCLIIFEAKELARVEIFGR